MAAAVSWNVSKIETFVLVSVRGVIRVKGEQRVERKEAQSVTVCPEPECLLLRDSVPPPLIIRLPPPH